MSKPTNILIVGVGGQGTLLAAEIVSSAFTRRGYDVKVSEIHGMAQRGGSVHTMIRFGEKVYSPLIPKREADILIAFELMEAVRWLDYLSPEGTVIVNDYRISPMPVITGAESYPEGCIGHLKKRAAKTVVVDALSKAEEAGNPKTANIVIIGVLARSIGIIPKPEWHEIIKAGVPPKTIESNLAAFDIGWGLVNC